MGVSVLPFLWLVACGPDYTAVQKVDTIEAYEEFLAQDPDSIYKFAIDKRLEELYLARAQKEMTREAWKAYVDRFPEGPNLKTAQKELELVAYSEAARTDTSESWKAFVDQFPKGDKWLVARAKGRIAYLEYGGLTTGEPKVERVNMAEDPKGELNGWGVSAEVTNTGAKTLEYVSITLDYLADDGHVLDSEDYPLVQKVWQLPASEEQTRPIAPGEKRTWVWTQSDEQVPKDWHQKVRLTITGLKFAE